MDDLKTTLGTKGKKCNLQFTTAAREYFERECGFTDEELEVFDCSFVEVEEVRIVTWEHTNYPYNLPVKKVLMIL